jgi:hypothetical protein
VEPTSLARGEYYVILHGFAAPASRPAARFPYTGLEAGEAFDRALAWARESATPTASFDLYHADSQSRALIVQITTDSQLVWPHR